MNNPCKKRLTVACSVRASLFTSLLSHSDGGNKRLSAQRQLFVHTAAAAAWMAVFLSVSQPNASDFWVRLSGCTPVVAFFTLTLHSCNCCLLLPANETIPSPQMHVLMGPSPFDLQEPSRP